MHRYSHEHLSDVLLESELWFIMHPHELVEDVTKGVVEEQFKL